MAFVDASCGTVGKDNIAYEHLHTCIFPRILRIVRSSVMILFEFDAINLVAFDKRFSAQHLLVCLPRCNDPIDETLYEEVTVN
jgi:hypothetical protein